MFSAIFAGVASLAGAILTRNDARRERARVAAANKAEAARVAAANKAAQQEVIKQNTQVRQNYYSNVVTDAQKAGISPLTALRTGAGQGYATAVAGTLGSPVYMDGTYMSPILSRNPLAAGLEAGTNVVLQELTRQKQYTHEARMDELEKQLMKAQIKSMTGELAGDNKDEKGRTQIDVFGYETTPANIDDAEVVEERYGDVASWLYGLAVLGADTIRNAPIITRNAKGMPPMNPKGFSNPFGSTLVSRGLEDRWKRSVLDALK
jgi:hypothetical protein